jgi:predicted transcriptional regulator
VHYWNNINYKKGEPMATLVELATEMVITRAKNSPLTAEEMMADLNRFYAALKKLEAGEIVVEEIVEEAAPAKTISLKEAFKKNEVVCMVCGRGGFKTLTRHLTTAHDMKPREYRKQFGVPAKQSLAAKSYSESRRQMATERNLAGNLAKAREVRMAKIGEAKAKPAGNGKAAGKRTVTKAAAKSKVAKA